MQTGDFKIVEPPTVEAVRTGTRLAVTEDPLGTLHADVSMRFILFRSLWQARQVLPNIAMMWRRKANQCHFGLWPTHAWTLAYAPFDDPEIIILAFAYHGGEGGTVAAPIVARVMQAYFELKAIDLAYKARQRINHAGLHAII